MLNIKMSTKGGPVFTFSLPGGRLVPLPPCQLHHWLQTGGHLPHETQISQESILQSMCLMLVTLEDKLRMVIQNPALNVYQYWKRTKHRW